MITPLDEFEADVHDALMKRLFMAARRLTRAARDASAYLQNDDAFCVEHRMEALDEWADAHNKLDLIYAKAMKASRELLAQPLIDQRRHEAAVKANATRKARKAKAA